MNQQQVDYVKQQLSLGLSEADVTSKLLEAGYPPEVVASLLHAAKQSVRTVAPATSAVIQKSEKRSKILVLVGIVVLLGIGFLGYLYMIEDSSFEENLSDFDPNDMSTWGEPVEFDAEGRPEVYRKKLPNGNISETRAFYYDDV